MFGFFRKKTGLDVIDDVVIAMYQRFTDGNLTKQELMEVVQTTMRAFKKASEAKDEHIPGNVLINISAFMVMYRAHKTQSEWLSHLNKEVDNYLDTGLRSNYLKNQLNVAF